MKNETEKHYDLLSEDGNDPVLDPPEPREYLLYSTVFFEKKNRRGFPRRFPFYSVISDIDHIRHLVSLEIERLLHFERSRSMMSVFFITTTLLLMPFLRRFTQ